MLTVNKQDVEKKGQGADFGSNAKKTVDVDEVEEEAECDDQDEILIETVRVEPTESYEFADEGKSEDPFMETSDTVDCSELYTVVEMPMRDEFECEECDFKVDSEDDLKRHVQKRHIQTSHEDETGHMCEYCPYRAKKVGTLRRHVLKSHTVEKPEPKSRCNRVVRKTEYTANQTFKCTDCEYKVKSAKTMKAHAVAKHPKPERANWFSYVRVVHRKDQDQEMVMYECRHCPHIRLDKESVEKHSVTRHGFTKSLLWYRCKDCTFKTVKKSDYRKHVLEHQPPEEISYGFLKCELCGYTNRSKCFIKKHMEMKHPTPEAVVLPEGGQDGGAAVIDLTD